MTGRAQQGTLGGLRHFRKVLTSNSRIKQNYVFRNVTAAKVDHLSKQFYKYIDYMCQQNIYFNEILKVINYMHLQLIASGVKTTKDDTTPDQLQQM